MHITIDTNEPLSDIDKQMLAVLSGTQTSAPAAEKAAPVAKKAAAKPAAAKPEPTPEPEPEADEDLVGSDEDEPTMEDAVRIATELVSSGGSAKVKAALAEVGAKKVSELKAGDIATFVNTLS